ncbi:dual specificity protein phosphatase 3 isoform X2 [Neodiprion virginianus]|uniref:dual specificity protein phosphatase 3 isoform X2 n=1 Tax=Neodiprion virginianus TaxID=2961670 RepID=UPI001EE6AB82|nr:dual specificity protein phosphatase 3 isoform X2 [Neodiprion virginianus]
MAQGGDSPKGDDFQKHLVDGETTGQYLADVVHKTRTNFRPLPGITDHDNYHISYRIQANVDCDEVYPNIYIGDAPTAKNKKYLKILDITHVLNTAEGKRFGFVDTDANYYKDTNIKYMGLPLADLASTCINEYFHTAATFIEEAVSTGGKAFVHCMMGISRSATCVVAYLMIKKQMLASEAIQTVRKNRDIHPNNGFLHQLAELDNQLRRQRL